MSRVHQVKLEIVRPGPPHNQLLSPLTPYMALCGEGSPVTFYLDFEHHQLLSRLQRLRYIDSDSSRAVPISERIRQSTVAEVGQDVAKILDDLRTLLAEEWRIFGTISRDGRDGKPELQGPHQMLQLRLVLSGSELALIPFEIAIAPQAFPGEGMEWTLQNHLPVVLTREIRRTRPDPVCWNSSSKPKVLLVAAGPEGMHVPLKDHVRVLRQSVDPWVRRVIPREGQDQKAVEHEKVKETKQRLRVLPQASLQQVYQICSQEKFTHVHILAHGDRYEQAGEERFGVALHPEPGSSQKEVVSGKRLAKALLAESEDGLGNSRPLMVTLMICDSGNQESVLVPGGSIAHDLQAAGIPWVFASQFPLTKRGSVLLTQDLYRRLLRGDDPRYALYETRRNLYMMSQRDHDWASLVTYSSIPQDFEDQVWEFFERQTRRAIEIRLDYADRLGSDSGNGPQASPGEVAQERQRQYGEAHRFMKRWENRLPQDDGTKSRIRIAEFYGMLGSTYKRIGLLDLAQAKDLESEEQKQAVKDAMETLRKARGAYQQAADQWVVEDNKFHWTTTQALSLGTVLARKAPKRPDESYLMARRLAEKDLERRQGENLAWAHGTLAELDLLKAVYVLSEPDEIPDELLESLVGHCEEIVRITGPGSFPVNSTRLQFLRYQRDLLEHMAFVDDKIKDWIKTAVSKAVKSLSYKDDDHKSQLPST